MSMFDVWIAKTLGKDLDREQEGGAIATMAWLSVAIGCRVHAISFPFAYALLRCWRSVVEGNRYRLDVPYKIPCVVLCYTILKAVLTAAAPSGTLAMNTTRG